MARDAAVRDPGARGVTNVVVAGLGGQGVLKASDIIADAAFRAGMDVKKAEVHGMSQRGGFVQSDVRFGPKVESPMVPSGEADYLLLLAADQAEAARACLRTDGTLVGPGAVEESGLANRKSINVALLGVLSRHLTIPEEHWMAAIRAALPEKLHEVNFAAFRLGRSKTG